MANFFSSKILNGAARSVTSAALILAVASLASRFLGLVRDRLLAGTFGAGDTLDVYYAAFRVPDLVYNLLITGALSAGFIPVFVSLWKKSEEKILPDPPFTKEGENESWQFVNSLLNILLAALLIIGGLFFIFTPQLMELITPGFEPEKMALVVTLTRVMFLSPLLLGISSILGGVLQSVKRFLVFSLTPIFYNLGIIIGILFLVPKFGVIGLAWGVALGALLHMLIQVPAVWTLGWRYSLAFNWKNAGIRRLARLMVPRTLTLAVSQLNFVAITILASFLAAGSLAIFNLSYNIWTFPLGVLAASLAIAVFPTLSESVAKEDWPNFADNFSVTFRQILFLILPISALLIALRAQIVRVILGTGQFNWEDTILAINSLQYLTLGLFAEALILLLVRAFFALEDTQTPFWLGLISSVARVSLAWFLSLSLGVAGLALGFALGGVINMLLLWLLLAQKIPDSRFSEILLSGVKILSASILAGVVTWATLRLAANFVDTRTFFGLLTQGGTAGLAGLVVYFLAALLLRSSEMKIFCQTINNRLPFRSVAPDKEIIQD